MANRVIPPSELIINDDGSAFHIHITPAQLRDNIILVGDPGRVTMVAEYFDTVDYDVQSREFHAIGGTYKGKPVMCISHGIGSDNLEIVLTELDALANIDFRTRQVKPEHRTLTLVRVGTSGSLQEHIHAGDFVLAAKAIGTDGILNYYAGRNSVCDLVFQDRLMRATQWDKLWAAPYVADADPELIERIGGTDMIRGYTVSAVGFYAPQGRQIRLPLADPDFLQKLEDFRFEERPITNFEMEGACLQGLSKLLGHKAATVCCIIAERRLNNADTDYKPRVRRLLETVLDRL